MSSLLVFNRVYRLEIQSFMLFSTDFVNYCPLNLLSGYLSSTYPPTLCE
jgi:hypothetical protein